MDLGSMSMMGNGNSSEDANTVHNKMTQPTGPVPTPSPVPASAVPGSSNGSSAARLADAGSCQRPVSVRGQVMTDEQMETLRRQISVYATICQQLVEMHKATVAQQNAISASRYGQSSTLDSALNSMGHKFASRQRWTPSQTQLQILEKIFQQGNGTPSKQRIKEISMELSQYGQISETNVYNWFQNRRARTKRKQQVGAANCESEFETDIDSQEEKKPRTDRDLSHDSSSAGQYEINSQNWESSGAQQLDSAQKGLQLSQRMGPGEESSAPFIKPDVDGHISTPLNPVGASTSQEFQRQIPVTNTGDSVIHMQKYKTYNVTE